MSARTYSFIDIAVLEPVRARFAAGDALAILTVDLDEVVWANGAGAALLGFDDIESVMGASPGFGLAARRQIAAAPGFPRALKDAPVAVRIASGLTSSLVSLLVSGITLPDGEPAVLLAVPAAILGSRASAEVAARVIEGIGEAGYFAALMDGEGRVSASSADLDALGLSAQTRAALVAEVLAEPDRLVKRLVPAAMGPIPTGVARLTDDPATILLIAVEEAEAFEPEAEEEAAGAGDDVFDGVGDDDDLPAPSDADIAERLDEDSAVAPEDGAPDRPPAVDAAGGSQPEQQTPPPATPDRPRADRPSGDSDDWYFARPAEERQKSAPAPAASAGEHDAADDTAATPMSRPDLASGPVRFVWRTDASGAFSAISDDFARAVGPDAAKVIGRRFRDVAAEFGLDPDGDIAGLLDRRDTWSGRSVMWPVAGTDLLAPVDLAALPIYNRERAFEGFRGFGVVRMADVVVDPAGLGLRLGRPAAEPEATAAPEPMAGVDETRAGQAEDASHEAATAAEAAPAEPAGEPHAPQREADPFGGEVPVISIAERRERRSSDKVIRLAEHRAPQAPAKQLSAGERNAFDEIRERLKKDYEAAERDDHGGTPREQDAAGMPAPASQADAAGPEDVEAGEEYHDEPSLALMDGAGDVAAGIAGEDDVSGLEQPLAVEDEDSRPSEEMRVSDGDTESGAEAVDDPVPATAEDDFDDGDEAVADEDGEEVRVETPAGEAAPAVEPVAVEQEVSLQGDVTHDDEGGVGHVARDDVVPADTQGEADEVDRADDVLRADEADEYVQAEPPAVEPVPSEASGADAGDDGTAARGDVDAPDQTRPARQAALPSEPPPLIATTGFLPSAFSQEAGRASVDADLINGLPVPLLVHAGDDLFFANREFLDLTGYASLEQIRREGGLGRLFVDGHADVAGPEGRRPRLRTLGGDDFAVDARLQSIRWRGRSALLLALRRIEAPAAPQPAASGAIEIGEMERLVAEMRTIIDTATDGVVLIANDGTIRNISRPAEALFGVDSHEVEGKPFTSLFAFESQRAARDYLGGLAENGVASVLNDGREVIGREARGRFIPLFMTIGRLPGGSGFCAVVRDITQWKRAEEELTQARTQAERASAQKTEFLARVSHEIRTPLNAIIGFSELMMDEKFGPIGSDRYRDYLRDINRSGNHVLDLVNDLLDISKIEAGEQEMNYEAVSLNDTLAESVAMMQPQANRERVIIRSSLASRLPEVVADLRSVRQIALNLLSNAIRYTQAGGQVIVSTSYEPTGDVVMRVRDTGVGMSLSEIDQALKPFRQINALKRGRHDGTGLGLPLTKAMVEANRARFSITSTPGEGTMVEITFPSTRVLAD